ncbi:helicase POLQ-like [Drosophila serrata]|uniref:helicase POLQ-like n=1 Tax=Drosophila serrata TaxID=7274 RepID=UPI000A1D21A7|nr:helicase POLQ-like [Drosophila serrata]XP_020814683.1 helicase POLQ-like [Drosophila serrata]XP_020814684.1 helicase POLQ-like [Drosophila serrata]
MSNQQSKNNGQNISNKRALNLTEEQHGSQEENHAKRQCTEGLFWPDSDDESFFSNAKLEDLLSGQKGELFGTQAQTSSSTRNNNNMMQSAVADDGLFGDTSFPDTTLKLEHAGTRTPADQNSRIDLSGDADADEVFKKINLNDLSVAEMEDIFHGAEDFSEPLMQNTQLFLDAVAFKVPRSPEKLHLSSAKDDESMSFISKSVLEGIVQGTQYETCEELKNRSILDPVNWESQAFADFERDNQARDNFPSKGEFYGLPDKVKKMILEHKGIKSLYEWQDECLNLPAIRQRKNLIYALPTSGGKTLVAEILMLRELLCRERNVLFILPYVSIVQEKVSAMSPFAIDLDFIVEEYTAGKGKCPPQPRRKRRSLFIASIEKGAVLMDSLIDVQRPHEIGLVVVDELHLIGERGRGATLEAFLTKVMFLNANIQIVGMSATIGNLSEISAFLNADVYTRGFRPVELKEYIKCGSDLLEINAAGQTLEEIFVPSRSVNYSYSEAVKKADPDHLAGLISECAPEHCCLVFCPSRKNCENVALLLSRIVPKQKFFEHRRSEKVDLMDALDKMCGILSPVLAKTLPYGIAYHHSGLTTDERKYIETAYRFGVVTVICCTSTLAAGVNLPAKRVIIRAPYVGQEFMTLCKYKQMVGRAGRAGLGEAGESILIAQSKDNLQVGQMLFSPMDKALSSLDQQEAVGLQSLILSVIGLNLAECRRDLNRLVNSTLLSVQASALDVAVDEIVLRILREMFKNKVLQVTEPLGKSKVNCSEIITTQDVNQTTARSGGDRRLLIGQSTRFKLTNIGRAAFKAGIDYKRASAIHKELRQAQQQLILTHYSHLLYLIVCFNSNERGDELFPADASILFQVYTSLPTDSQALFKQLGFTEAHAARLFKNQSVQGPLSLQLNRMYKVLILSDILDLMPLPNVASKYNVERGTLQHLISQSIAASSAIVRLCEELEEFWCYKPLFERILHKMDRCGTLELEPLMELPGVKINRAKQLYAAGFRSIEDLAKIRPILLVQSVEHMPLRVATEIVSAAKIILMKKLDHLEEETENLKICLQSSNKD